MVNSGVILGVFSQVTVGAPEGSPASRRVLRTICQVSVGAPEGPWRWRRVLRTMMKIGIRQEKILTVKITQIPKFAPEVAVASQQQC